MKKLLLTMKTSLFLFGVGLIVMTSPVHADDIEIYGIADANNPPVNVLFVFDLSGSMNLNIDGTALARKTGEPSRYDILKQALTNVLAKNKDISNLRIGLSWFSHYASGIRWPITGIRDDISGRDPSIPAGTYETWEYLPHAFESFGTINDRWKTRMVPALLEAAYYYRGEKVWRGAREPEFWHVNKKKFTWGSKYSAHFSSYEPSATALSSPYPPYRGTKAYAKYPQVGYTPKRYCNSSPVFPESTKQKPSWCHNGYNTVADPLVNWGINRLRINVRNCGSEIAYRNKTTCSVPSSQYECTPQGPDPETGLPRPPICKCPSDKLVTTKTPYTRYYCSHDYVYDKKRWLGATYISPITATCTPSYIVLLSDGAPTLNTSGTLKRIKKMTGKSSCADIPNAPDGKCGPELIEYLANNDQVPSFEGSRVFTYTIGFNVDGPGREYLELLAQKGNGAFYPASNATDLEDAFDLIIDSITGDNESFTGLVTTIKASTLSSDNRVFMNIFKPGDTQSWKGNTKGYFISPDGLKDTNGNDAVVFVDGAERFRDGAQSFWSTSPDGNFVELGGASEKLGVSTRNIFTYTDTDSPSNSPLTRITTSETKITPALLGVSNDTEKDDLINWLYASKMTDPLHAKPVMISYSNMDILFSTTNQGLLHAIDATNPTDYGDHNGGNEIFAFIPKELLPQLKDHKANLNAAGHLYGLDGPISFYHDDINKDHIVNNGERVLLYMGMRRGGNHYYALDISDPATPKLAWQIDGGDGDFAELGQTWSRMVPTTIKWFGSNRKVLIFGGGYDPDQDDHDQRQIDDLGNAVFMVDALDGSLLWKATKGNPSAEMKYSIPSEITVIDTDDDRIADRIYFGDMGGQVWRFDLDQSGGGSSINGYRLAELANNGSKRKNRRFYSAPSVAKVRGKSGLFWAITIGSGYRAHPLDFGTDDYFYMIRDTNVDEGAPSLPWSLVRENDLYDVTPNTIGQGNGGTGAQVEQDKADALAILESKHGWKLKLKHSGEKNLTPSLIFDNKVAFTTFAPANAGNSICGGGGGIGRLYLVDLATATPVKDFYDDTTPTHNLTAENRYATVPGMGIPTEPIAYFPPGLGRADLYVGKHKTTSIDNPLVRINWKIVK